MTATEYLQQGSCLEQRIRSHMERLEELRASRYGISSPRLQADRVQTSPDSRPGFVRILERIDRMEERILREIDMLEALRNQIEDTIHTLLRPDYQLLLEYRYLEGMAWDEIRALLHVGRTALFNWHRKALSLLVLPENPICIKNAD